jgi:hypothetical protein
VLSSGKEEIAYLSSEPVIESVRFGQERILLRDLNLKDGSFKVEM